MCEKGNSREFTQSVEPGASAKMAQLTILGDFSKY